MTGFEPAATRPPDVYSTGLSYIPKMGVGVIVSVSVGVGVRDYFEYLVDLIMPSIAFDICVYRSYRS